EYLRKFYHLDVSHGLRSKRDVTAVETKIGEMQDFFGLEKSGQLDHRTLEVMRRERCGVPDAEQYSSQPNRPKWKNHTITYIQNYTPDLTKQEVENTFRRALKIWSDVAPLKFIRVDHGEADIMINFASKHGDFFPFDGPRGVLAHAFEPGEDIGGDVHFDEDEVWRMGRYNLFTVAAHELGHSLGLSHSKDPSALMYPSYRYSSMTQYTLPRDDALAIQALYGKTIKLGVMAPPEKCDPGMTFDAVAMIGQELAFFKNYMWLRAIGPDRQYFLREGYSSTYLPSISSPVDAAYDITSKGVAYTFTSKYWIVQQLNKKSYYQRSIYDFGFPPGVKQIDAAVHVNAFGKTYFFVRDVYYYDEDKNAMDPGYPRKIKTDWPAIGNKIDAAFE
uniref:Matrix metallopeptidase 20a (enamelysin) n=1 Tax=Paramormyrops kingsleyae TaxID=1676925 RepID=A0A3B3SR85_9TELE